MDCHAKREVIEIYFEMLTTITSFVCQILIPAP